MPNLDLDQVAANQNQKEVTINTALDQLDGALTEQLTLDLSAAGVTLTAVQWTRNWLFLLSGHTVARTVTIPATKRPAIFKNTGTAPVTIQVDAGGGSLVIAADQTVLAYCDGVNLTSVGGGVSAFTALTDTFASYAGKGGQTLRVKADASGIETAATYPDAPKAADFPLTYNTNCSVIDSSEGLVYDGGTPKTGDIAGACVKLAPVAAEFEVEARLDLGRARLGNWAGMGVGMYAGGNYYFTGIRFDGGYSIAAHKNADAGFHVDLTNADNYGRGIQGGWFYVRRFKPSAGSLLVGIDMAVGATNCAFTGWTLQQAQNLASASGCLATTSGLTPATTANITVTSSVAATQSCMVVPINSNDGVTVPTLRTSASGSGNWSSVDVPLPAGTVEGDAIIIGIRHQFGVLFDDAKNWKIQSNFGSAVADGSSLSVSKVLTAADIALGHVSFRSPQLGNGCWFCAVIQAGTYSSIGVAMFNHLGSVTSFSLSSDNVQLIYSVDKFWLENMNLNNWAAYFNAAPTHVGFCTWTNRTVGPISLICRSWKQSW
jgi:hypothetical protein